MCEAGRIRHHLKHNLWREESTVLFVGYQADGTLGRKLIDGADSVSLFNEEIAVNAKIASIVGISGHADRDMMLEWLSKMSNSPKRIFVNHGEDMVCDSFSQTIYNKLNIPSCAPFSGDEYDMLLEEFTARGKIVKVSKISDGRRRANIAFDKLLSAGKRLMTIIGLAKNTMTNKEMAKFTDQIHDFCDKYARKTNNK
jgi:metallo-beta-lactamase family protein